MIRQVSALKKRLDIMIRDCDGDILLDHGSGSYKFTHYDWYPEGYDQEDHEWKKERIYIYYKDSVEDKEKLYMKVTDEELRRPKGEYDYCHWFIHAKWEKKYPNILELSEYEFKEWMENVGLV